VKHNYVGIVVGGSFLLAFGIVLYSIAGYIVLNHQHALDQVTVWAHKPSASATEQMHRTGMSQDAQFIYTASRPVVESQRDFNSTCSVVTTDTSILGCYIETTKRIYLFHETDSRLDGTEELWAAHEMLRAAWDRMPPAQQRSLVGPLNDVLAAHGGGDINLAGRTSDIARDDPKDRDAELYAMVGTEAPLVGATLEKSYAKYFTSRAVVTTLANHANSYVVALRHKVVALTATIDTLGKSLDVQAKTFNADVKRLGADIDSFNARARTLGGFASEAQFNTQRAALIARQHALQARVKQINGRVDQFNADLKKLESLSTTAAGLVKSLNVDLDPLPGIGA
jgi:hypothetical protein